MEFMRQLKRDGHYTVLITSKSLENEEWPRESLDEIYFMPDKEKEWHMPDVIKGVAFLFRNRNFDKIVALDDFDVEKVAHLREHFRMPGMGDSAARFFRDKLAMRMRAKAGGLPIPEFTPLFNYVAVTEFTDRVEAPYILKPRMQAGAIGMKILETKEKLWEVVHSLGDEMSYYLVEKFVPGDIFHVDTIMDQGEIKFAVASGYGLPPMEVAHGGRVFTSRTLKRGSKTEKALREMNERVLITLGLSHGVSHTEFIIAKDGTINFLETSARVGGANIVELIEAGTGLNLWAEWAKLETLDENEPYKLPKLKKDYSALMNSLAKQEHPDLSAYNDPEVYWKLNKPYHAGLVLSSSDFDRITELLTQYVDRFYKDFFITVPMKDKPSY